MLYGLEALVLSVTEHQALDKFHRQNLRLIQHLPNSTAIPAIHLLSGILPASALIDIRILTLFHKIIALETPSQPSVFMKQFIERQLAMKNHESTSWAAHVKELLRKYKLPPVHNLLADPPGKSAWKSKLNKAVHASWINALKEEAEEMSSLCYLNISACSTNTVHPVWTGLSCPLSIKKATIKALLLTQRYPLSTCRVAGARQREKCPLCNEDPEDTIHFLLHCPTLATTRAPYMHKIMDMCRKLKISVDTDNLTKLILDSTHLPKAVPNHEELCRNFIFKMHHKRSVQLGGVSAYRLSHC